MGKKKNPSEEEVRSAYREVLGRDPDAGGLANYMRSGLSGDRLKADLASSQEGQRRRADPSKYGAKAVDPANLSAKQKEYYDVWKLQNPNTAFYSTHLQGLKWRMGAGSAAAYKEEVLGNVRVIPGYKDPETGKWVDQTVIVSEQAARNLGPHLGKHFKGNKKGVTYFFPETFIDADGVTQNVTLGGDFSKNEVYKDQDGKSTGMKVAVATGAKKSGLFGTLGDVLSLGGTIKPIKKLMDDPMRHLEKYLGKGAAEVAGVVSAINPLGDLTNAVMFGSKGATRVDEWQARTVERIGIDPEDFEKFQDIQERVAVTAAQAVLYAFSPFTLGATAALAVGMEAAYQGAKAYEANQFNRDFDWSSAAVDIAMAGIPTGSGASWANVGKAAAKAAVSSAAKQKFSQYSGYDAAGRGIKNKGDVDWGEVGKSAVIAGLGQFTAGVKLPGSNFLGVNLYTTGLRYAMADPEDRKGILFESLATAGATAGSSFISGYRQGGARGSWNSFKNASIGTFDLKQSNFFNPDPTRELPWRQEFRNQMGRPQLVSSEAVETSRGLVPMQDPGYGMFGGGYSIAPKENLNKPFGIEYQVVKSSSPEAKNFAAWGTVAGNTDHRYLNMASAFGGRGRAMIVRGSLTTGQLARGFGSLFVPFLAYSKGDSGRSFSPAAYWSDAASRNMTQQFESRFENYYKNSNDLQPQPKLMY